MQVVDFVRSNLETILNESNFIVDIRFNPNHSRPKLHILLDGDQGITIDECARVSRELSRKIEERDLIKGSFILEVSSPGVDSPLKLYRQYPQHVGRKILVKKQDGTQTEGLLKSVSPEGIDIERKTHNKKGSSQPDNASEEFIPFDQIQEANILVSF